MKIFSKENGFVKLCSNVLSFVMKYKITMIFVILTSIYSVYRHNAPYDKRILWGFVNFTFLVSSVWASFFVYKLMNYLKNDNKLMTAILIVLSISIYFLVDFVSKNDDASIKKYVLPTIWELLCFYICLKKQDITLAKYLNKYVSSAFVVLLYECVIAVGVAIVMGIYQVLFHDISDLIIDVEIFQFVLVILIGSLMMLDNEERELHKFYSLLVKYIMFVLVIIGYAIIYCYFIKVIVLRTIPSNSIFTICTLLFSIGIPIALMATHFNNEYPLYNVAKILPIIFVPCSIFQIYSIGIRIWTYGITTDRYLCILIILFEFIYIVLYIFNNGKLSVVVIIAAILVTFFTYVPVINVFDFPIVNYKIILADFNKNPKKYENVMSRVLSAYDFLSDDDISKLNISDNNINLIKNAETIVKEKNDISKSAYGHFDYKIKDIDITSYNRLSFGTIEEKDIEYDDNNKLCDIILNKTFEKTDEKYDIIKVDLTEYLTYVKTCIDVEPKSYSIKGFDKMPNVVEIDDNSKFIIYSISVTYNRDKDVFSNIHLMGLVVSKV